jgi:hypothetical protein
LRAQPITGGFRGRFPGTTGCQLALENTCGLLLKVADEDQLDASLRDRRGLMHSREIIAALRMGGASVALDQQIADLICGKPRLVPSAQWMKIVGSRPTASLDGALLVYKNVPDFISTDPVEVCINALEEWI